MKHRVGALLLVVVCGCGSVVAEDDDTGETKTPSALACNDANEQCQPGTCNTDDGSSTMLPGASCMNCHSRGNLEDDRRARTVPTSTTAEDELYFTVAGTSFLDLAGSGPLQGATVRVTDSLGKVAILTTNSAGNFYTTTPVTPPLSAEIEVGGEVRKMASKVDSGSCNSCHTCDGPPGGKLHGP